MVRKRILAVLATAGTALGLVLGVTMPVSHADTMDNIRGSVNTTRSNTGCPPLTNNPQLEAAAQNLVRTSIDNGAFGGYSGPTTQASTANEAAQDSINRVNVALEERLKDCSWKDFGVGFYRKDSAQLSIVAVYVGKPSAAPAGPPPVAAPPVNCTDGTTVPAGQTCPVVKPKAVTNAITATFDNSGATQFVVTVKNSSPLPASCNYDAKGPLGDTTRTFNVDPNGNDTETFDGIATIGHVAQYKITITCTDSSNTQTEPLGSVTKTVGW